MDHVDLSRPRNSRQYLRLFLTGFAMGAADIVPGVSGGTMAFILGIYETLLNAIKSFNGRAIQLLAGFKFAALLEHIPVLFLLSVGMGILTAIFSLSNALHYALENHPVLVFSFFGGLILASILAIGIKLSWTPKTIAGAVIGALSAFILVGLNPMQSADHSPIVLFFSGMIAIMAMILPGISGSFILLILGQYQFILGAVRSFDIVSIVSVALGCLVGIISFSRILSWLLKRHEQVTVAVLVGFMVGSLRKIWDEVVLGAAARSVFDVAEMLFALGLTFLGFVLVSVLDHLQTRNNPIVSRVWRTQLNTDVAN